MSFAIVKNTTFVACIAGMAVTTGIAVGCAVSTNNVMSRLDTAVAALTVAEANAQAAAADRDACAEAADLWQLSAVAFATQLAAGTTDISEGNDHANAAEAAGCTTP